MVEGAALEPGINRGPVTDLIDSPYLVLSDVFVYEKKTERFSPTGPIASCPRTENLFSGKVWEKVLSTFKRGIGSGSEPGHARAVLGAGARRNYIVDMVLDLTNLRIAVRENLLYVA